MKVKLTKTNSEWSSLTLAEQQQASVIGDAPFLPTVGKRFCVGNVKTSPVTELLSDGKFRTINSIYKLKIL